MLTFLIMAGGTGERFWPLSTKEKPKQFLSIFSSKPLIVEAYERVLPLVSSRQQIFISTNSLQLKALKEALPELPEENIIIEPTFKDTAAAIGYGSLMISRYFKNPTIVVLASDHLITEPEHFRETLRIAVQAAEQPRILTLGIKPSYPETGYGYIAIEKGKCNVPEKSLGFREKPNLELAQEYVDSGKFLWNSGIFVFTYETLMEAFRKFASEYLPIFHRIESLVAKNEGLQTTELVRPVFEDFPKKSIDFAIMEKADNIYVVPSSFGWSDVGTFASFDQLFPHDEEGNVIKGGLPVMVDSHNNVIIGDNSGTEMILLGISDCVIVHTSKGILISKKDNISDLKKGVALLK
jgi:mannose-1-phosphate guanylyltransferase